MGHVFGPRVARLYEAWEKSAEGILVDRLSSQLILRLLRPGKGERILDIGCGTGNHVLLFYRLGFDVTGLDASPYMLDVARSRLGDKASLKIGRAEDLPFEDNEFDLATLIFTLEFLDDPGDFLPCFMILSLERHICSIYGGLRAMRERHMATCPSNGEASR